MVCPLWAKLRNEPSGFIQNVVEAAVIEVNSWQGQVKLSGGFACGLGTGVLIDEKKWGRRLAQTSERAVKGKHQRARIGRSLEAIRDVNEDTPLLRGVDFGPDIFYFDAGFPAAQGFVDVIRREA